MSASGIPEKYILINLFQLCKYFFLPVFFFLLNKGLFAQGDLQLAPPQTGSATVYFTKSTCIRFEFRLAGSVIRYTLNGVEPDENSVIYKDPLCISSPVIIKAKSFAPGFISSPVIAVQCIKTSGKIKSIEGTLPEPPYDKNGLKMLYDELAGGNSIGNGWLGFRNDTLQWKIRFNKKQRVSKIHMGLLQAQSSWIFYPIKIELVSFDGKILGQELLNANADPAPNERKIFSFPLRKKISELIIRINNLKSLPGWHPGTGNKPWMFIDEIAVE